MSREAKHRDKIVRAAAELLRRHGYAATGINEIAALSGAPKGSLYHHFPGGKAQIAAEAVRYAGERVSATITDLVRGHRNAAAAIRAYGRLLNDWMAKSAFVDGCPISTTLLETGPQDAAIAEAGRAAFAAWAEGFASALRASGVPETEAHAVARSAIMLLEGALIFTRVERDGFAITAAAEQAAALFEAAMAKAARPRCVPLTPAG